MSARRLATALVLALALGAPAARAARVADLTTHAGDVPRRLVGYGLVVGLDGSGDRSFGSAQDATPTVRSVVNLLRRFQIEIPPDRLRLRNVAAVLVTAEVSPYLRAGGRFEVQVSAIGDGVSLRGGTLWMTPLVTDPNQPPVATAQGALFVSADDTGRWVWARRANNARIADGGILEADPPAVVAVPRLALRDPDFGTAARIAQAVNAAFGAGTAKVEDPGAISLTPKADSTGLPGFLAAVDSVTVNAPAPARVVIDARDGTVVAGGEITVAASVVSHRGITLQIGGVPVPPSAPPAGGATEAGGSPPGSLVHFEPRASVEDVAAGLHAAGAKADDIAAIFEALRAAGALHAEVRVR